jgi:hypothetical protein
LHKQAVAFAVEDYTTFFMLVKSGRKGLVSKQSCSWFSGLFRCGRPSFSFLKGRSFRLSIHLLRPSWFVEVGHESTV